MKRPAVMAIACMIVVLICIATVLLVRHSEEEESYDILSQTHIISQEYVKLRYQTERLLTNHDTYPNYDAWNMELELLILRWENLEKHATILSRNAESETDATGYPGLQKVNAYTAREITHIFDSAPRGNGTRPIMYLAEQLGVDARTAFNVLKISQAQIEADAWDEAGDIFEILQNAAEAVQTGCKITAYVGGAILSGGATSTIGAVLSNASMIVSGADLVLEIGETTSKIAAGYNSDAVAFFDDIRGYTKPPAAILGFTNTFYDYGNWDSWGQVSAIIFTGEQVTSLLVEDEIAGGAIDDLTGFVGMTYTFAHETEDLPPTVDIAILTHDDDKQEWLADNHIDLKPEDPESILHIDSMHVETIEAAIISDGGSILTEEEYELMENERLMQEELVLLNEKLATQLYACYDTDIPVITATDTSTAHAHKQQCLDQCPQLPMTQLEKTEVCSTSDTQYPSIAEELEQLQDTCMQRCKPQYDYLLKIESAYTNNSDFIRQIHTWYENCPKLCKQVYACIPLRPLSYSDCANSCTYAYIQEIRTSTIAVSDHSSTESLECKRRVILEIQRETVAMLERYGHTIDDL